MPCMCGDSECPSCGTAQGTRTPAKLFVTMYSVTRCYGGPEEGGWWYDWYEPVKDAHIELPGEASDVAIDLARGALTERYGWKNKHSRSSVLGGADCTIIVEEQLHENASRERPHYE